MKTAPRFLLLLLLLAEASMQPSRAEFSEQQVRSAYVLNFIKFVEWPPAALGRGGKISLCVVGDEGLRASLSALSGRKVGDRELQVQSHDGSDGLSGCHVLYIGERERRRFIPIIKSLGEAPVLTISDIPGFAERGGGIGLLVRNDKMLFEVNLASTRKADLRLSGQMLNLAANIFGK